MGKVVGAIGPEGRTDIPSPSEEGRPPEESLTLEGFLIELEQYADQLRRNACDELALTLTGGVVEEEDEEDIAGDAYEYLARRFIKMGSLELEKLGQKFSRLTHEIIAQEALRDLCAEIREEKDPSRREELVGRLDGILMQESGEAWEEAKILEENPQVAHERWQGEPEDVETLRQQAIQDARTESDHWKSQADKLGELLRAELNQ